jgi:phosphate acetyltransferase/phosphate butyryltransferase
MSKPAEQAWPHVEFRDLVENHPFEEICLGDRAVLSRVLTREDIQIFGVISGDISPATLDEELVKGQMPPQFVAHSMWGSALVSTVVATRFPGPGTVQLDQTLHFAHPVKIGDEVAVTVRVVAKHPADRTVDLDVEAVNQAGVRVITGRVRVAAPGEKIKRPRTILPTVRLTDAYARYYRHLINMTRGLAPIRTAVVHPVDGVSLLGAIRAAEQGLIEPVLIGPAARIRAVAEQESVDLGRCALMDTEHSHAAAERAVALARAGEVDAVMKGSLHTDELMAAAVDKERGIRTARRMSHVFIMDVPTYPRPLLITDAAITIEPTLDDKVDIVKNAIDLAHALGIEEPKVAILSAVETVTTKMRSTLDAAALCKMADRGQIRGAILDGPLAFDNVVSEVAARTKGIVSPVAGRADILLVPDIESGNMLAKQLEYLADAQSAGIVLGARVPVILTSRADKELSRMASCAVALLLVRRPREPVK